MLLLRELCIYIFTGLFSLQELLDMLKAKRYHSTVKIRHIPDIENAHEDLRALDRTGEPENATEKYIVINLSNESAYYSIMRQVNTIMRMLYGILGNMFLRGYIFQKLLLA